jgi:hypothetical protein
MPGSGVGQAAARACLACALLGCGGGSGATDRGGAGARFSTGLPGDQPLTELTSDQWSTICARAFAFYDDTHVSQNLCKAQAPFSAQLTYPPTDAALQAACNACYSSCVQSMTTGALTNCGGLSPSFTCTGTVGEYEDCLTAIAAGYAAAAQSAPSCDQLRLADGGVTTAAAGSVQDPCQALVVKCPGVAFPSRGSTGTCGTP